MIGCKWGDKTKVNAYGNIDQYQTRLVVKCFTQKRALINMKYFLKFLKGFF